jgi:hypothetical protein
MMHEEFLFTIAEVGAAFAGFSTLVSVFGFRSSDGGAPTKAISMLILSILAISFALLPALASIYELPDEPSWRILCFTYGISWAIYWIYILRAIRGARFGVGFSDIQLSNRLNAFLVHPISILALLGGALGLWGSYVDRIYVTAVLIMLFLSGLLFVQIVVTLLQLGIRREEK